MLDELLAHPDVTEDLGLESPIGVMALHGGLEAGTAELAHDLADAVDASRYVVTQPPDLAWHVPSIRYSPTQSPRLSQFLGHVTLAVSLHGFGRVRLPRSVLVGGGNRTAAGVVARALRRHTSLRVVDDLEAIPRSLRGCHPANPVNLPAKGGVQLELSASARREPLRSELYRALLAAIPDLADPAYS